MAKKGRIAFADLIDDSSLAVLPATDLTPTSAPLSDLAHNPLNPREHYDDVDELAASLTESGQLQPITTVSREVFLTHYPTHAEKLGQARWVVITGNRRLAAARKSELEHLDMIVQERLGSGTDPRFSEAILIENIHRAALPPLLEARELQGLVARYGSQSVVARRISKSQGWISQRLTLLRLIPHLQTQLSQGQISVKEARKIALEPADQQQAALDRLRRGSENVSAQAKPDRPLNSPSFVDLLPGNRSTKELPAATSHASVDQSEAKVKTRIKGKEMALKDHLAPEGQVATLAQRLKGRLSHDYLSELTTILTASDPQQRLELAQLLVVDDCGSITR